MKIAMTISGQPRRYEYGFQELKKWFLDKYDIDVYLHSWVGDKFYKYNFFNGGELQKTYNVQGDIYNHLVEIYQPKDYLFEKSITFDATDIKGSYNQRLNSQMGMFMSLKRSWDLLENSGIKYDLIIRTRYDLLFTHHVAYNCPFLTDITQLDPKKLHYFAYPPSWSENESFDLGSYQLNDLFAVGGYEVMYNYHNVFPNMLYTQFYNKDYENAYGDLFVNETLLFYHLKEYHTPMNGILSGFVENRGKDGGPKILR